jgi:hypothetical protein
MFVLPLLGMRATTSFNRSGLNGRVFTIRRSSMLILVNGAHGIPYQALSPHPTDRPDMAASINNKRTSRNVGYAGSAWDATRVHCQVVDEKLSEPRHVAERSPPRLSCIDAGLPLRSSASQASFPSPERAHARFQAGVRSSSGSACFRSDTPTRCHRG